MRYWRNLLIALLLVAVSCCYGLWAEERRQVRTLQVCARNLVSVEWALHMFGHDNGFYPVSLGLLIPRYLTAIPTCPSVGKDTYSHGYKSNGREVFYTVECRGGQHAVLNLEEGSPRCSHDIGLHWGVAVLDNRRESLQRALEKGFLGSTMDQVEKAVREYGLEVVERHGEEALQCREIASPLSDFAPQLLPWFSFVGARCTEVDVHYTLRPR